MLRAELHRKLGDFSLDLALEAAPGETLALMGESGSGKTATLRLLAGLLDPDRGRIALGEEIYFDAATGARVPANRRSIGYVPQDYALFPHLDVYENVAFGLRAQSLRGPDVRDRADAALTRFGLDSFARRRPSELSGGQQQRVALARALVMEPRLLLLDEPLSALDARTRGEVLGELGEVLGALTCITVYVTHSLREAEAIGNRILLLQGGRIPTHPSGDNPGSESSAPSSGPQPAPRS